MKNDACNFDEVEAKAITTAFRIDKYVIDHPGCSTADIARDLAVLMNTVRGTLLRLRAAGHVKKAIKQEWNNEKKQGEHITRWWPGIEDGIALKERIDGAPRQRIVKKWKTQPVQIDPIAAALFGIDQKDQQEGISN